MHYDVIITNIKKQTKDKSFGFQIYKNNINFSSNKSNDNH